MPEAWVKREQTVHEDEEHRERNRPAELATKRSQCLECAVVPGRAPDGRQIVCGELVCVQFQSSRKRASSAETGAAGSSRYPSTRATL